jgi:large subunit ribosomal protein L32
MPNPKRKHTRSRRDSRRAQNWKLDAMSASVCENKECGRKRPPHSVCPHCGWYNGKIAVAPKVKEEKREGGEGEQK